MKQFILFTDDELVDAYVHGNNEAFDCLLERYQSKLFSYIFFLVHDSDLADDLFQETFVKAIVMMKQGRYVASGKFSSWIMRIAHNLIVDSFRQEKKEGVSCSDSPDSVWLNDIRLTEENIESQMMREQTFEELRLMVDRLPDNQREMVYMRFYQELSFKEIAEILGVSINTALGRMRYALINLRKQMARRRRVACGALAVSC